MGGDQGKDGNRMKGMISRYADTQAFADRYVPALQDVTKSSMPVSYELCQGWERCSQESDNPKAQDEETAQVRETSHSKY